MRMRPFISLPASVVLSILLCGCLVSKAPLITAANSDRPLPAHFILHDDASKDNLHDEGSKDNRATVDLADDNSYIVSSPPAGDDKSHRAEDRLRFKRIADNLYASSRSEIDNDTGAVAQYVYGYMRVIDGSKVAFQELNCSDFEASDLKKLGVEVMKTDGYRYLMCTIPSIEVLEILIKNYLNDPKNADNIKSNEEGAMHITGK